MTRSPPPTEDEIHAYVDNALEPSRRAEIEDVLRTDARLSARIAAYQDDRDALRRALSGVIARPVPPAWRARIEAATRNRPAVPRRWAIAAGVAAFLAVGTGASLLWPTGDTILNEAHAARASGLPGGNAVDDGPAQIARLNAALGLKLRSPDLQRFGFRLAGLVVGGSRSAQLDYRDPSGRRLTIYLRPSRGTARFELLREGDNRVCIWQDDVVGAVIIAPMSTAEMLRVASIAYSAFNL